MANNKHEVKADVEVNTIQGLAEFAALACAVGFGVASAKFNLFNPLLVAGGAGVIGFALTHADKKLGVIAILAAVLVFFAGMYLPGMMA